MDLLTGKRILITRAASQSSPFRVLLEAQGATTIEMPTLEIGPPSSWAQLDEAIAHLPRYHWLILTSANAVESVWQRLAAADPTPDLSQLKIAVVGQKTAAALEQQGHQPDFTPPEFIADSLVKHFPEPLSGLRVLFPRVESGGREILVNAFRAAGAEVDEVAAYESGCPKVADAMAIAALQDHSLSAITFASAKTVRHFALLAQGELGERWQQQLQGVAIASIGPQTSAACLEILGRVDVEATEYTLEGLTRAIAHHFSRCAL
jgi:uroporphyrinogen-III synthase